jgi:subtilisin family serine protease
MRKLIGIVIVMLLINISLITIGISNEITSINNNLDNYPKYKFVPGEFIVKFKDKDFSILHMQNLNRKYDVISMIKIFKNSEGTMLDNIYLIHVPKDSDILSLVNSYSSYPEVEYAEPNYLYHICSNPNDPGFTNQWALENTGQPNPNSGSGTPDCDIDALEAWDIETGNSNVIIAIIDSGVDYNHPDLIDNIWLNEDEIPDNEVDDDNNGFIDDIRGWNFLTDESYNHNDPLDVSGHGTLCAGLAGAVTNNALGIAGVCWNCKIMVIRSFDSNGYGSNEDIALGIQYAIDNRANIISMSFGDYNPSNLMNDSIELAYNEGIVLVASAGNEDTSKICYPAACKEVIAVAGTDHDDERMYIREWNIISNYGYWIDVAAPGEWTYTTMPTYHVTLNDYGMDKNYSFGACGTSAACAHVSGLAGLILSKNPSYSPDKIKAIIRANVDPYNSEYYIGTGRINAYKSLMELNKQPEIPDTPQGDTSGKIRREYTFTSSSTDPDGNELWYFWDWGDGNYSDWLGPYDSGVICEASYTWQQEANFSIRVKVKDGVGGESYWSDPLVFSTPKNKQINNPLNHYLENHPHLFPILRQLLNL